tara:strand:- start:203 stop:577 length:375 start_codon:yes stop_codon:yes gene_type:complete
LIAVELPRPVDWGAPREKTNTTTAILKAIPTAKPSAADSLSTPTTTAAAIAKTSNPKGKAQVGFFLVVDSTIPSSAESTATFGSAPGAPQQRLYFKPLPHAQAAFLDCDILPPSKLLGSISLPD